MAEVRIGRTTYPLRIKQGAIFLLVLRYKQPDNTPVDLTSATVRMQIRRDPNSADPPIFDSDDHTGSVTITDEPDGEITLSITHAITSGFPAPFDGQYDIFLTQSNSVREDILSGAARVVAAVTR